MNLNFTGAQFLSYVHENKFIGDGPFRIGGIKKLTIESFLDERTNPLQSGVSGVQNIIQQLVTSSHNFQNIVINNNNFGPGKIMSASFPSEVGVTNSAVRLGKSTYEIEIYYSGDGDLHNLPRVEGDQLSDGKFLTGVYYALSGHQFINSISEDFSFQTSADESYSYTHNINIGYISGLVEDPIVKSKYVAETLFNGAGDLGFLDSGPSRSGFYDNNGHKIFSESYNLQNGECSFTKTFNSRPFYELNDSYSHDLTHSISSDERGIISITENANILGKSEIDRNESMKQGMDTLVIQARQRCENIFNHYSGFYGSGGKPSHGVVSGLNQDHITLNKNLNEKSAEGSYHITFNNDYSLSGNNQHNYSLSLSSSAGIISVSEEGNVVHFDTKKSTSNPIQLINNFNINTLPEIRCGEFYSSSMYRDKKLNLVKSTMSYSKSGKSIQYGREFSDDERIINNRNVKKMDVDVSDVYVTQVSNTYFVPNQEKEILQKKDLHTMSNRDIRISTNFNRPSLNPYSNVSVLPIHKGGSYTNVPEALQCTLDSGTLEAYKLGLTAGNTGLFLSKISYDVNSENDLNLNMTVSYLQDD